MPTKLTNAQLLLISKGEKRTLENFRLGAYLSERSALTIDALTEAACKDRFNYVRQIYASARWVLKTSNPRYRIVLARSYYAMYHAARAVAYFTVGGDDHQEHSELPKHIPNDFPNRAQWENKLKNARLERNKADYDPYPRSDRAFASVAKSTFQTAEAFLATARRYLIQKGCSL